MSSLAESLSAWPEVPADQRATGPRPVYISESLEPTIVEHLECKGWKVVDVRLLSGREAALGKLEGVTTGSIRPPSNSNWQRALELELKVHKLLSDRSEAPSQEADKALKSTDDVNALLTFGRSDVTNVPALVAQHTPLTQLPEQRKGRPRGSKDLKPRKSSGEPRGVALQMKLKKEQRQADPFGLAADAKAEKEQK